MSPIWGSRTKGIVWMSSWSRALGCVGAERYPHTTTQGQGSARRLRLPLLMMGLHPAHAHEQTWLSMATCRCICWGASRSNWPLVATGGAGLVELVRQPKPSTGAACIAEMPGRVS